MDIGDGACLELLDRFCYLGDMQSIDGDADAAVELEYESVGINLGS